MRLRTTLILAFVALALLQVAVVVPFALDQLSALLSRQQDSRVNQQMDVVEETAKRLDRDVTRAIDDIAVVQEGRLLHEEGGDELRIAGELMRQRGLQVLTLFDAKGVTLSSGHFAANLGELDPQLFAVTQSKPGAAVVVMVKLPGASGIGTHPALVAARAIDVGDTKQWAVGGLLLDDEKAGALHRLTGARVEIIADNHTFGAAGDPPKDPTVRTYPLGPAQLRFSFSRADFFATQRQVLRSFLALMGTGLLLSLAIGVLLSRRFTRPVEALTDAARKIGEGQLDVKVPEQGSRELKQLVTTFNRMTNDLQQTTERLVASERVAAWQEVARRLAHEIKNPLTPIRMSLETLIAASAKKDARFEAMFAQSASAVLEEVDRLKRIVDEFSQFARLPRPQLKRLDLSGLAQQVLGLYAAHEIAGPGSPTLDYALDAPASLEVNADRDQLTQVLVNLIKNAEEAMIDAGKGGKITVRVFSRAPSVVLEVEDQGPGIPESLLPRLFEPYVTGKAGGSGLGLAIASRIVQEHEGRLEAGKAASGSGARFTVTLPSV
ncbi:MAG: ATP-binding protein [Myxococcaceae bacterium]